ncbi:MAG: hypothetical protein JRF56_01475 [Deltaproteobacteria bacterium]|nr:hypothetical protein [Deltaproteobacteria bacterium]
MAFRQTAYGCNGRCDYGLDALVAHNGGRAQIGKIGSLDPADRSAQATKSKEAAFYEGIFPKV